MASVVLINPGKDPRFAIQEPLSLGFIASYLEKHDIEVAIIDELAGHNVEKELNRHKPYVVGITATTPLVQDAYRIADMCRKEGILTVIGGVHASVLPEEALKHADIVVQGEGEKAMVDIIKEGNVRSGVISRPYIRNIDDVPPPARHLLDMDFYLKTKDRIPESYLYFVPPHTPTAAILTSRGCPHDCMFCHNTWRGMPYRSLSPERVVSEIRGLVTTYGVKALFFIEDNLFINKKRLKKVCEIITKEGIDIIWGGNARVDNIDREILQVAKDAGCRQITFGFESGSQRILDVLNKGTTVEQNKRAIELCNHLGIIPQGTFMIGNPTETLEEMRATQRFIEESEIESVGVCYATPYPGTRLWTWCEQQNLLPRTLKWSDFTYDKLPVSLSRNVSSCDLRTMRIDIEATVFFRTKAPLKFPKLIKGAFLHPIEAMRKGFEILMKPQRLRALAKRIKL